RPLVADVDHRYLGGAKIDPVVFNIDIVSLGAEKNSSDIDSIEYLANPADERAIAALHRQQVRLGDDHDREYIKNGGGRQDLVKARAHFPRLYLVVIKQNAFVRHR